MRASNVCQGRQSSSSYRAWMVLAMLLTLASTPALARFQPQPCKNGYTEQQEVTEGAKAAAQVGQQMPLLPDSDPVSQYVRQLGGRLAQRAPGYRWPFNFHVVNVADINAFALPGGSIFVNLGTVQAAETEAQLAGVMAHEISHVVQRHATCNITKERTPSLLAGIGQIAAGVLLPGAAGAVVQQGIGLGTGLSFLRNSRESERQADLMGTDILYDTGYDPRAMPQFFEIIEGKYGAGGSQFLSDHPNPGNRVGYVNDEIATLPRRASNVKTSADFTRIKKTVGSMHPYTAKEVAAGGWKRGGGGRAPVGTATGNPRPGARLTAADWTPQGEWQSFSGDGFTVSYPGNWRAGGSGAGAIIAPQGGVGDQNAVGYGMLADRFQPAQANDIGAATEQLVAQIQQQNPQLRAGRAEDVEVNQVHGRALEATNSGAAGGGTERDWLVALPEPGTNALRYVVFVAPEADFNTLRPTFEKMLRTFKFTQ